MDNRERGAFLPRETRRSRYKRCSGNDDILWSSKGFESLRPTALQCSEVESTQYDQVT